MLAALGQPNPRLTSQNSMDLWLTRQLAAYGKEDPPPQRKKPVPISVLQKAVKYHLLASSHKAKAIANMLLLGFYFMLRPGEYAHTSSKRLNLLSPYLAPAIQPSVQSPQQ
jgi:hypothetical protein